MLHLQQWNQILQNKWSTPNSNPTVPPHCLSHSLGGNELTGQGAQVPESGARMGASTYCK